jgi:hypothetical protein
MANLITKKQKKIVKTDYLIRLLSVCLLIVSLLGLFILAYIIPYYISVSKKDIMVAEKFESIINIENKENTGDSVSLEINKTIEQMKAFDLYSQDSFFPSIYFNKVVASKNSNIQINKLSFGITGEGVEQFLVSGLAKNREGLVSFIEDLKIKAGFSGVESPISDFAQARDISFTLNIKI